MLELKNFIDGEWRDAQGGGRFDVVNPATGETIATAPDSAPADVERAVDAARVTFDERGWPRTPERERGRHPASGRRDRSPRARTAGADGDGGLRQAPG